MGNYTGYDTDLPTTTVARTRTGTGTSTRRGVDNDIRRDAAQRVAAMGGPLRTRRPANMRPAARPAPVTDEDEDEIKTPIPVRVQVQRKWGDVQGARRSKGQDWKPAVFWISLTLVVVIGFWLVGTTGAAWWALHITDPESYGPTRGSVVQGVFGGGDSRERPSTLIGLNDHGRISIIFLLAGDPSKAKAYTAPVDTTGADNVGTDVVDIQVRDVDHDGHQDAAVTIFGPSFSVPFKRDVAATYTLYGDGNGGFKTQPQQKKEGA